MSLNQAFWSEALATYLCVEGQAALADVLGLEHLVHRHRGREKIV